MKTLSVKPGAHEGHQEGVLAPLQGLGLGSKLNDKASHTLNCIQ